MSFTQSDYKGEELLILEPLLGFRQWVYRDSKLISMYTSYWENGDLTATCQKYYDDETREKHRSPDSECSCGIYAHYLPLESYKKTKNGIFGVIEASGKILMGTKGFRAEKAKIVALAGLGDHNEWFEVTKPAFPEPTRSLVDFCTSIGVPYFPTVEQMVREFPQKDLSSLGVPDLTEWSESIPVEREKQKEREERFARQAVENRRKDQQRLDYYKKLSDQTPTFEQFKTWGFNTKQEYETFKHLGGYS